MEKQEGKRTYEIAYLLHFEEEGAEIMSALKQVEAEIVKEGQLSHIKLAYPIKKEKSAYFGYLNFSVEPSQIEKLTSLLQLNSKVLRFLIVTPFSQRGEGSVRREEMKDVLRTEARPPQKQRSVVETQVLSNEALEEKLEEILS